MAVILHYELVVFNIYSGRNHFKKFHFFSMKVSMYKQYIKIH